MAESEYLRQAVGEPLAKCLADVVLHRPNDPIEYIALWLYKHASNIQNELQRVKEAELLAKEIEEQKEAEKLMIQLALEEEQQHQKEREEVAKQLEEAQMLQVYQADNSIDKHGPVSAVHSVQSAHHTSMPDGVEEEEEEEEEEETASPVQSHISQNVGSESEVELQTEMPKSEEFDFSLM